MSVINVSYSYNLDTLPKEMILEIISHCPKDLRSLSAVNRALNQISKDESLKPVWKRHYCHRETIQNNLKNANFFSNWIEYNRLSQFDLLYPFHVKDGHLARVKFTSEMRPAYRSGYYIKLEVIDLKTGKKEWTDIDGLLVQFEDIFKNNITGIQIDNNRVFVSIFGEQLRWIDLAKGIPYNLSSCVQRDSAIHKEPEEYELFCIPSRPYVFQVRNDDMFVGCNHGVIERWKFGDKKTLHTTQKIQTYSYNIDLTNPYSRIRKYCLKADDKTLYASRSKHVIQSWDLKTGEEKYGFWMGAEINSILLTDKHLIVASDRIRMWEKDTRKEVKQFAEGHYINCMFMMGGLLFTGEDNGTVRVWDIEKGTGTLIASNCGKIDQIQFVQGKLVINGNLILEFGESEIEIDELNFDRIQKMRNTLLGINNSMDWSNFGSQLLLEFNTLPLKHKYKIYEELYFVKTSTYFDSQSKNYLGCGEDAFHHRNGLSSDWAEQKQAIINYADKLKRK